MKSFTDIALDPRIRDAVQELGFETLTPIQEKTIPHLLTSDQDLIAFAQTGTGKTAAFGLPVIQRTDVDNKKPQTLILCPTRELCMQISRDLTNYSKYLKGITIVPVYGGASMDTQIRALNKEAQVVVATPGRANDLINRKKLQLDNVTRVVLDEADEMLTMGFREDLDAILAATYHHKQTMLFSATMSDEVMKITKKYMNSPIEISATPMNTGAENVRHLYYMVHARDRYEVLKRIADINPNIYGIVFCRTRKETKEVAAKFMQDGYNADAIHGDLSQAQRDEVMGRFRMRQLQLLIATDVAARGLDVTDLSHIINFDLPDDIEVYIHRSGRTGRAGKSGISIAIIHMRETGKIRDIEKKFGIRFSKESVPSGKDICQKQLFSLMDKLEQVEVDEEQIGPFLPAIYQKLEWLSREDLIKHFVSTEFNRFLAYYKDAVDINITEHTGSDGRNRREKRTREERRRTPFTKLHINLGSKNNLTPARLMGLINEGLNSRNSTVGKIEIMNTFSFFEIEEQTETRLMAALQGQIFDSVPVVVQFVQDKPAYETSSRPQSRNRGSANFGKPGRRIHGAKRKNTGAARNRRKP